MWPRGMVRDMAMIWAKLTISTDPGKGHLKNFDPATSSIFTSTIIRYATTPTSSSFLHIFFVILSNLSIFTSFLFPVHSQVIRTG